MKDDRVGGSRKAGERGTERQRAREQDGGEREIKDIKWRKEQPREGCEKERECACMCVSEEREMTGR